jgi:hypothetical protein
MTFVVLWSGTEQGCYCGDPQAYHIFDAIFAPAKKVPV